MVAIRGHFDGKVFVPDEPVNVPTDRSLILHVEVAPERVPSANKTALDVLDELEGTIDAPADWSDEHDHYLYGTPKRNPKGSQ
jgi:hypothetical protein